MKDLMDMNWPCHWDKKQKCDHDFLCSECDRQPAPEDKPNGKAEPVRISWRWEYGGGRFPECPSCGEMPYDLERCIFCGQQFIQDDPALREYARPPEEIRMDCPFCGAKDAMVGVRAKSNGHFHGHCELCGVRVME